MLATEQKLQGEYTTLQPSIARDAVSATVRGRSFDRRFPGVATTWVVRSLCLVALAVSGYLAWTSMVAGHVYGCGGGAVFDCGHVLHSRWARLFSIPVSVPAVALYASLLGILAFMNTKALVQLKHVGWSVVTLGGLSAGLAALCLSDFR
ncbi:MAG: vitamin K epoxide reductase family protein [Planctomycetaceae bacterium]